MHRRFLTLFAAVSFGIALCASGCSGQGEGERCDINDDNSGTDDCASGLMCYSKSNLGGAAAADGTDICCPYDRTQATTAICSIANTPASNVPPPATDGGADADAGATNEASADGNADAPASETDAPVDSPIDSPIDSPVDSPLDSPAD